METETVTQSGTATMMEERQALIGSEDQRANGTLTSRSWDLKEPEELKPEQSGESRFLNITRKLLRLTCYLFCFAITLGTSFMSKITLSLMASQIKTNQTMDLCLQGTNKRYIVDTSIYERMGWNWAIFLVLIVPECLVFMTCAWVCMLKKIKKPKSNAFLMVLLGETLHVIGVCLLVFVLAPSMDSISSVMFLNSLCLVPACLILVGRLTKERVLYVKVLFDIGSILAIVGGPILWAQTEQRSYMLPLAGIFISCAWWENFVDENSNFSLLVYLAKLRMIMKKDNSRYFTYMLISVWKVAIIFVIFLIYLGTTVNHDLLDLLSNLVEAFNVQKVSLIQTWQTSETYLPGIRGEDLYSSQYLPLYFLLIQISCSLVCYLTSIFSCQICIQEFSFSLPLCMSVPVTVFLTSSACSWRMENFCFMTDIFPKHVYWKCPEGDFPTDFFGHKYGWTWILWFMAQAYVTSHIWNPLYVKKMAIERLFVIPLYNGAIVEQSLLLNRRKHRKSANDKNNACIENTSSCRSESVIDNLEKFKPKADRKIYACATMWREDPDEMMGMLKSVMRVAKHLHNRRPSRKYLKNDPSALFEFEVHIFFDDAFAWKDKTVKQNGKEVVIKHTVNGKKVPIKSYEVNEFVKALVDQMGKAAAKVYPKNPLEPPLLILTPYAGRLQWNLTDGTPVIVHLKDKNLIRHKKRWSQIMYMFYLLGHIVKDPKNNNRRSEIEKNTFILALDGDINFKPESVTRLLDLMEDESLGAACGRIHPIGAGPIVWYQKFEYAIGHWLQKAAEHVIGCVLCSPGCFSLFRAEALMKVTNTYATVATKAAEYLQYDQGEDRWLCTLLLKKGYRIEYSAASDAYTHAPESFFDFFIQRRRWGPSTMANIMDLLLDYKETSQKNDSISRPYIAYQGMIMLGTILGPGTIFLMVVGAMVSAFQISNYYALMYNVIPIGLFILICFYAHNDIQLTFAMILSAAYALLMMAVLIATVIQLREEGISSPSGIFLVAIASSFLISAIAHPQEFTCVSHGFLYFMLVPSMYLLLQIYSLINLYNISWGTREKPKEETEEEEAEDDEDDEEQEKGKQDGFSEFFGLKHKESTLSKLCQCFTIKRDKIYLKEIIERMINVEKSTEVICELMGRQNSPAFGNRRFFPNTNESLPIIKETKNEESTDEDAGHVILSDKTKKEDSKRKAWKDAIWSEDPVFKNLKRQYLLPDEEKFWEDMIQKYLEPLETNKKIKKAVNLELIELRNKVVFGIFMANAVFILIVFLLQLNKDQLFIEWPIDAKYNITFLPDSNRVRIDYEYLKMDPIGLVFVFFFGTILVLQFLAMLVHRFGTFSHIMADTSLKCESDTDEDNYPLSTNSNDVKPKNDDGKSDNEDSEPQTNDGGEQQREGIGERQENQGEPRAEEVNSNSNQGYSMSSPSVLGTRRLRSSKKFDPLEKEARRKLKNDIRLLLVPNTSPPSRRHTQLRRASQNPIIQQLWLKEGFVTENDLEIITNGSHKSTKRLSLFKKSLHKPPSPQYADNSAFTSNENLV